jgi:hypothetical protein
MQQPFPAPDDQGYRQWQGWKKNVGSYPVSAPEPPVSRAGRLNPGLYRIIRHVPLFDNRGWGISIYNGIPDRISPEKKTETIKKR